MEVEGSSSNSKHSKRRATAPNAEKKRTRSRIPVWQSTLIQLMRDECIRSGTLTDAIRTLIKTLANEIDSDRTGVWLLNKERDAVESSEVYVSASNSFDWHHGYETPGYLERFVQSSGPDLLVVDDIEQADRLGGPTEDIVSKCNLKSIIHAPIESHGELIGFLTCATIGRRKAWTTEQQLCALAIVNLTALVIERHEKLIVETNVRNSAERLKRHREELNALSTSDEFLKADVTAIVNRVACLIKDELSVDAVVIRLIEEKYVIETYAKVYAEKAQHLSTVTSFHAEDLPVDWMACLENGPIAISDCTQVTLGNAFYRRLVEQFDMRATIHAPVLTNGRLGGYVACGITKQPKGKYTVD